ncbi:hypothetical protein [Nonomuraea solani]|uniref:hypothetical protein n=1 Tax=Nonomuraea solani TaxID=1144553 RepID=UPI0011B018E1|nr:hypothetical protein [Nonomuraea solani]
MAEQLRQVGEQPYQASKQLLGMGDQGRDGQPRRRTVSGRARKRAIRAQATLTGVPYSVARRRFEAFPEGMFEGPAGQGRTVYPVSTDGHRRMLIDRRQGRTLEQRVHDTHLAADLPWGRARHLAERFPPTRGESGTGVGLLYHGETRQDVLALVYAMIAEQAPSLVPSVGELAWAAQLGQETAVDIVCSLLDRTARLMLDQEPSLLRNQAVAALAAARVAPHPEARDHAERLSGLLAPHIPQRWEELCFEGAGQILDALLTVAEDGHAPGTRVRIAAGPHAGATGTIVSGRWLLTGPPRAYVVRPDGVAASVVADPDDLVVLAFRAPSRRES